MYHVSRFSTFKDVEAASMNDAITEFEATSVSQFRCLESTHADTAFVSVEFIDHAKEPDIYVSEQLPFADTTRVILNRITILLHQYTSELKKEIWKVQISSCMRIKKRRSPTVSMETSQIMN